MAHKIHIRQLFTLLPRLPVKRRLLAVACGGAPKSPLDSRLPGGQCPHPCIAQGSCASQLSRLRALPCAAFPAPGTHWNPPDGSDVPCRSRGSHCSPGGGLLTLCTHSDRHGGGAVRPHPTAAPLRNHRACDTSWQLSPYGCELPGGKDGTQLPIAPRGPRRRPCRPRRAPNKRLSAEGQMKASWGRGEGTLYRDGSSVEAGTLFGSQPHVKVAWRPEHCLRGSSGSRALPLWAAARTRATPPRPRSCAAPSQPSASLSRVVPSVTEAC